MGVRNIIMNGVIGKGYIKKIIFEYVNKDMRREIVNKLFNYFGEEFFR